VESIVKKVPRQATGSRRDPSDAARGRTTALVSEALISPRALLDLRERLAVECESFATRRGREKMWSWSLVRLRPHQRRAEAVKLPQALIRNKMHLEFGASGRRGAP